MQTSVEISGALHRSRISCFSPGLSKETTRGFVSFMWHLLSWCWGIFASDYKHIFVLKNKGLMNNCIGQRPTTVSGSTRSPQRFLVNATSTPILWVSASGTLTGCVVHSRAAKVAPEWFHSTFHCYKMMLHHFLSLQQVKLHHLAGSCSVVGIPASSQLGLLARCAGLFLGSWITITEQLKF